MATIQMIRQGYTAAEAEAAMNGYSWDKEEVEVVTPEEELHAKEGDGETRARLFDFQKSKLLELKEAGFNTTIRKEREGFGPSREYDHLSIGFTAEETRHFRDNPEAAEKLADAIREASKGQGGAMKSFAMTRPHFDTQHGHVHIMLHRFAVDLSARRIENGDDISKRSNAAAFLDRLNAALDARGLPKMSDFRNQEGQGVHADVKSQEAKLQVADQIEEAGGIAVQRADAPPLSSISVEQDSLAKMEGVARGEAERLQVEIMKLQEAQRQAVERVMLAQQAQAALAERDTLKKTISDLENTKAELEGKAAGLEHQVESQAAIIESLDGRVQAAEAQIEGQQAQINEQLATLQERYNQILERDEKISELNQEIGTLQEENQSLNGKVNELQSTVEAMGVERDQLTEQIETVARDRDAIRNELSTTKADLAATRETMASQSELLKQMRAELDRSRADFEQLRSEMGEMKAQNASMAQEMGELKTQNATMAGEIASLKEQNASMKNELDAARKNAPTYDFMVGAAIERLKAEGMKPVRDNNLGAIGRMDLADGKQATVHANAERDAMIMRSRDGEVLHREGNPDKVNALEAAVNQQVRADLEAAARKNIGGQENNSPEKGGKDDDGR